MKEKKFYSELFKRYIIPNEKDYWAYTRAEVLFRLDELNEKKCTCIGCTNDRKKYELFLQKLKNRSKGIPA